MTSPCISQLLRALVGTLVLLAGSAALARADAANHPPVIFWTSAPVAPEETVLVTGSGLGDDPKVELLRLADGDTHQPTDSAINWSNAVRPDVQQPADQSIKFTIPGEQQPGVFAYRIRTAGGSATGFVNEPVTYWLQGDQGPSASPGGWVRLFGHNLGRIRKALGSSPTLRLRGPRTLTLNLAADTWSARADLPKDLPAGDYEVRLHNGAGGDLAWSAPLTLHVEAPADWPGAIYNVHDYGADGSSTHDDTATIQTALDKAGAAGGGVVLLPRGRYQVSGTLTIPRFTVLRGESEDTACLFWPDSPKPPEAMIRGTNHFAVEELTIYASNHRDILVGDTGEKPDSGHVRFWQVRVRADAYRGHLTPEQVDQRFRDAQKLSSGGADSIRVGGTDVEIGECDIYGSGRSLYLSRTSGGWVHDNHLSNGRWGWYCISGSDKLIFERNQIQGADLMSTGGGLNCLDGSRYSQNVFYSGNEVNETNGWDRESMTTDAGGGAYVGHVASCHEVHLSLASEPKATDWIGAGVFVLRGSGAGQVRRVVKFDETEVTLDQPFAAPLDATSELTITQYQGHYLVIGNRFTDCGPLQFYGTAIENVVAANTGTRMQGFKALGIDYDGVQPCLRCQFLGNQLSEDYYHWTNASDPAMELMAQKPGWNQASVLRNNILSNDATIRLETVSDALVEKNAISDTDTGIFASKSCERVLLTGNRFTRVAHETVDEAGQMAALQERLKPFIDRPEPIAVYDFESLDNGKIPDVSGNHFSAAVFGGVKLVPDGHQGKAAAFDGTGYLQINEPALFNAPNLTVDFWVNPATVAGRRGLIAKRFDGGLSPLVICQVNNSITFEASSPDEKWRFNFGGPPVLEVGKWIRVTVVTKEGEGVSLYLDGKLAAEKKETGPRSPNDQPLIIGREAWGADPAGSEKPGFFIGSLDSIKIWTRAFTAEEIAGNGGH